MNQANRALIIGASDDVPARAPSTCGSLVICADGGLHHAQRWGITPHVVVADLDSAVGDVEGWCREHGVEFLRFPVEKDKTDSELAVDTALARGATALTLTGVWGGRVDHSLANLGLVYRLAQAGTQAEILTGSARLFSLCGTATLELEVGQVISLLPLTETCRGVTIQGVYYPLRNASLRRGSTLGVSNVAVAEVVEVTCAEGVLLVVLPQK